MMLDTLDRWANSPKHRIIIFLFVAALIVRIAYCLINPNPYQGLIKGEMIADAMEYDMLARTLASGGGFGYYPDAPTAFRNPLLPFLMAGVYLFTGPHPVAAQGLMVVLGSLIPPVLFLLGRRIVEPVSALLAAVAAVFYPSLVIFSVSTMSEVPFILLMILTILYWYRFSSVARSGWGIVIWGGIFAGLALLTRSVLGFLLPLWFFYLLVAGGPERWRHLLRYSLFCIVTVIVLLPWSIRNYAAFGEFSWITSNGGFNLWHQHNLLSPDGTLYSRQDIQQELQRIHLLSKKRVAAGEDPVEVNRPFLASSVRGYLMRLGPEETEYVKSFDGLNELQVDRRLAKEAFTAIYKYPIRAAIKVIKNTIKFWDPFHDPNLINRFRLYNLAYGIMAPFLVWGLILSLKQWRRYMLFYLTIISFWAISAISMHLERFRLPIDTIGLIFAATALIALFRRNGKPWFPWVIIGVVVTVNLIIIIFAVPFFNNLRNTIHGIG